MKQRILIFAALIIGLFFLQGCDDDLRIKFSKLPEGARVFVDNFFKDKPIAYVERDKDNGAYEYEVVLSDGTEINFDKSGLWHSVDCKYSVLPAGIMLNVIEVHIADKYPEVKAYKVEREIGGYEVSVSSGLKLIYTSEGTFVRQGVDR